MQAMKKSLLWKTAEIAMKNAYCPYSQFAVGAAILSPSGKIYGGCNVENVSYPVGTCAEAGAIATMIATGDKEIQEILIISNGSDLIAPCGACCQRILEFAKPTTLVHLAHLDGRQQTYTIAELLPHSFQNEGLKNE